MMQVRLENKIFWPPMAAFSLVLAVRNRSRLSRLVFPPNIICLLAYLSLAGASVLWAFRPEVSFTRFVQQTLILTSIVLPAMLAVRTADMMRGLFLCFAFAAILNVIFVFDNSPAIVDMLKGYPGYFGGKNYLGEFAGIALMLSLYEARNRGLRRVWGIIFAIIAVILLFVSNSKTAIALAFVVTLMAGVTLLVGRITRVSPAIVLLCVFVGYVVLSGLSGITSDRISYSLYGDSTFTGRAIIWNFANYEIERRLLLGWGYRSFWLVGPDAPSVVDAPGWVKTMPNAHNGYVDTKLELGYVGLALLVLFIYLTLHGIKRVADRDPTRAWLVLSLSMYIIFYNFLESVWMRDFEFLWVVFVIVAAEIGRYWQPLFPKRTTYVSRTHRQGGARPADALGRLRLRNSIDGVLRSEANRRAV
jgi:O-antigen ligase